MRLAPSRPFAALVAVTALLGLGAQAAEAVQVVDAAPLDLRCDYNPGLDPSGIHQWGGGAGRVAFEAPDSVVEGSTFKLTKTRISVATPVVGPLAALYDFDTLSGTISAGINSGTPQIPSGATSPAVAFTNLHVATTGDVTFSLPLGTGASAAGFWTIGPVDGAPVPLSFGGIHVLAQATNSADPSQAPIEVQVDCEPLNDAPVLATVNVSSALPIVTSVGPTSGKAFLNTWVTIRGANFTKARAVTFGGSNKALFYVVKSPTVIQALTPGLRPGTYPVYVTTPIGGRSPAPTAAGTFTVKPW